MSILSCDERPENKQKNTRILPSSSGNINELVIVVNNSLWNGKVGKQLKTIFEQEVKGIPQQEPIYRILHTTKKMFGRILKVHRNILVVEIGDKDSYISKKDKYASPQQYQNIISTTPEGLIKLLKQKQKQIIQKYRTSDIAILQKDLRKTSWNKIPFLQNKGIKMDIPQAYTIAKEEENFIWMKKETHKSSLSLMIYTIPIKNEFNFNPNSAMIRDSISKIHIQSYVKDSYMQIEKAYLPYMSNKILDNMICIETKGVWNMKNDFMGGAFINYLMIDEKNKRLIGIDGFSYAPAKEKRNIMFQLEAILNSFRLK